MAKRIIAGLLLALGLLTVLAGCAGPETWTPKPYLEINGEAVENPSLEKLRAGLESLDNSAESYVYLELAQPLDGVWYLSVALPMAEYEDGLGYILEACAEDGAGGYTYLQQRTQSQEELLAWFEDFYRGEAAPDLAGWTDITDWYFDDYYYDEYYYGDDYYGESPVAPV